MDPCFKAQGIAIDSPAYDRIHKGRIIRDTNRWAVSLLESLRAAMAKKYLEERGNERSTGTQKLEDLCSAFGGNRRGTSAAFRGGTQGSGPGKEIRRLPGSTRSTTGAVRG